MIDAQAVTETVKNASHVLLDGGAVMAIIAAAALIARDIIKTKRRNGAMTPGKSPDCLDHRDKLNRIEEWKTGAEGDLKEIKTDIKTLLGRIPERD